MNGIMLGIGLDINLGKPYSYMGVGGTLMMCFLTARLVGSCVKLSYALRRSMIK
jgi:hypothetical protein